MKRILCSLSAFAVFLTPVTALSIAQPITAQTQDLQQEAQRLLEQGKQQGNSLEAIETFKQALIIARQIKDRQIEGNILHSIGFTYSNIEQSQQALKYYQQALLIRQEEGDRSDEATTLNDIGVVYNKIGQPQQALEYYQQALLIRQEEGDRVWEATTLSNIGVVYSMIGQPQEALKYHQQALLIRQEEGDRAREAITLNNIGFVYSMIGQPQEALKYYQQSLPILQQEGDRTVEATTLNNIGAVYNNIGQPQKALEYYQQALLIHQEVNDLAGEATTLNNIGEVYRKIGQLQEALKYYQQALPILQQVENRRVEATTLNNIGAVYNNIGQPQKALNYYNQALLIHQEVNNRAGEATTLNNIGLVYDEIGQPQEALKYYDQALPILQQVKNRRVEAITRNNIGRVYHKIGQPQEALNYYNQALLIHQEVNDRAGEATTLNNIGEVYRKIGQPQQALSYYQKALPIRQKVNDLAGEAVTLNNIGLVYRKIGQHQEALEYYQQALPILQKVGDLSVEAITLSNIGAVYRDTNQPSKAIENFEQSVTITLEMRGGLLRENRKDFLEAEKETAIALTDLLLEQNQADEAFEWINLATTADLADYNRLIDARVANPEAQKAIDNWKQKNQQLEFLRQQLQDDFSEEQARQIRELEERVNQQAEAIADSFPEVAELFETKPNDIAQLKNNIPQDTLVIQPVLLTDTIAFFLLTQDTLEVVQSDINPKEFDLLVDRYLNQLEDHQNSDYYVTSAKLYDILIRPFEAKIEEKLPKHLAIIATGRLRYLPFETLYNEQTDRFLIQKYPIHYLTNISRRSLNSSANNTSSLKALSLANPQPTQVDLEGTEAEAQHLENKFPGSEAYVGAEATLDTFKTQASRFPILHLGTHGCFNQGGCPNLGMEANTILFANNEQYDIANAVLLGLQNTELITLGACQTAKEANADGQEISGLAYIFERAGAKSVIASLWNAEDNISSEIMRQFYDNLQKGMSKSEAMRQAKLSQIDTHPRFWSPFILIGDAGK